MRFLFLLSSFTLAPAALAQPASHPFYPLAEGNAWIYDAYGEGGGHRTATVLGWEGEGEAAYWRVQTSFAPFAGGAVTIGECAVRIVEEGSNHRVQVTEISGQGCLSLVVRPLLPFSGTPQNAWITGRLQALVLASASLPNPNGPSTFCTRFAEGVGVFSRSECAGIFGGGGNLNERLVYASIGGVTYGTHPDDFFAEYDPMQYMPLAVCNRWTYSVTRGETGSPPSQYHNHYSITGFDQATGRYDLRLERFNNLELATTFSCRIRMSPAGRIELSGHSACVLGTTPSPEARWSLRMIGHSGVRSVTIAGTPYDVLAVSFGHSPARYHAYDNIVSSSYESAHGIGMLYYDDSYAQGGGGYGRGLRFTLEYAKVGDTEYGLNPVSIEEPPPIEPPIEPPTPELPRPAQPFGATLYPNPAGRASHLALTLPAPAEGRIEIYDVLGRRWRDERLGTIPAGASTHDLKADGLAPGVYFVRVHVGSAVVVLRRLVVLE
jgi:hypothetical protein